MVEGINQRKRRGTIEGSAVIQGGRDTHRCLVDIWNAEINFPHDGKYSAQLPIGTMVCVLVERSASAEQTTREIFIIAIQICLLDGDRDVNRIPAYSRCK